MLTHTPAVLHEQVTQVTLSIGPTREGLRTGGLPLLTAGQQPPLIVFRHFAPDNANPAALWKWSEPRPLTGLMRDDRIRCGVVCRRRRNRALRRTRPPAPALVLCGPARVRREFPTAP